MENVDVLPRDSGNWRARYNMDGGRTMAGRIEINILGLETGVICIPESKEA
jgi:hypothetical protein